MRKRLFMAAIWLCVAPVANALPWGMDMRGQQDSTIPGEETFQAAGVLLNWGGVPVAGKTVYAFQVDAQGNILRSFAVSDSGSLALTSPSGRSDAAGRFTIKVRRDYALKGQKGLKLVALCSDPGIVDVGPQMVLVNVTDDLKDLDAGKLSFSRGMSGTKLLDTGSMGSGARFKLQKEGWVTSERLTTGLSLKLESPIRTKVKGFTAEVTSLVAEPDGVLVWGNVTTSARTGTAVQWEAVLENGWVEGYRMRDVDLAGLQGQEVAIPSPSGKLLVGRVEGDKVLVAK